MSDLTGRRTYNQKVFALDGGARSQYRIHVGHIHYKDTSAQFQDVDTRLEFKNGAWRQDKASWVAEIPEYADGRFLFHNQFEGNDHDIFARPIASHVQGQLVTDGLWPNKQVKYTDAFGTGQHLLATARNHGIWKVIQVDAPPAGGGNLRFDYVIGLSAGADRWETQKRARRIISPRTQAVDLTGERIKIGTDKGSFIRTALMWDSAGNTQPVPISIFPQNGKLVLRKTIPAEFLAKAVFPVFTDHPTDYFAGAGDGHVVVDTGVGGWDGFHDRTSGDGHTDTGASAEIGVQKISTLTYPMWRAFWPVDTSGIADGDTVDAAILSVQCSGKDNDDNDGDDYIAVVQTTQASNTELVNGDFDECGDVDNPTEAASIDIGSIDTSGFGGQMNDWTLDATGRGWVNKTGYTKLGFREGHDATDSAISTGKNKIQTFTSEYTGTDKDPHLDITASAGGGDVTATPSAQTGTYTLQTPSVDLINNPTVTPSALTGTLALQTPTVVIDTTHAPSTLTASFTLNAPSVTVDVAPATLTGTLTLNAPTVLSDITVTPATLTLTGTLNAPTISADNTQTPATLTLTSTLNAPTPAVTVAPSTLTASLTLNTPTIDVGGAWEGIDSTYLYDCCDAASHPGTTTDCQGALDGTDSWYHPATETHYMILDLTTTKTVSQVRGRSFSSQDPTSVNIYVSDSPSVWGTAVATGITTWQDTDQWQTVDVTNKAGRYIKVEIIDTENASDWMRFGDIIPTMTIFDAFTQAAADVTVEPALFTITGTVNAPTPAVDKAPASLSATHTLNDPEQIIDASPQPMYLSLTATVNAPTVVIDDTHAVGAALTLTATLNAPTVIVGTIVYPSTVTGTFTLNAPTVVIDATPAPSALTLTATLNAPTVVIDATHAVGAALTLTATLNAPTVLAGVTLYPSTLTMTSTLNTPTVLLSITMTPSVLTLTGTLNAPTPDVTVAPASLSMTATLNAPSIDSSPTVTVGAFVLTATVYAPTLSGVVAPPAETFSLTLNAPSLFVTIAPSVLTATFTLHSPTVGVTAITITPAVQTITATLNAPTVSVGAVTITPSTLTTTMTVYDPSASIGAWWTEVTTDATTWTEQAVAATEWTEVWT